MKVGASHTPSLTLLPLTSPTPTQHRWVPRHSPTTASSSSGMSSVRALTSSVWSVEAVLCALLDKLTARRRKSRIVDRNKIGKLSQINVSKVRTLGRMGAGQNEHPEGGQVCSDHPFWMQEKRLVGAVVQPKRRVQVSELRSVARRDRFDDAVCAPPPPPPRSRGSSQAGRPAARRRL